MLVSRKASQARIHKDEATCKIRKALVVDRAKILFRKVFHPSCILCIRDYLIYPVFYNSVPTLLYFTLRGRTTLLRSDLFHIL